MSERVNMDRESNKPRRDDANYQEYVDPDKTRDIEREKEEQREREQPVEKERPTQSSR
jgi:hypothetical protein